MVLVRNPLCHTQLLYGIVPLWDELAQFWLMLTPKNLFIRKTVCQFPGHQGAVRGLTSSTDGEMLISCGTDCTWVIAATLFFFFVLILYAMIYLQLFFSMYNNLLTVKFLIFRFLIKKYMMMGMDSDVHAFSVGSWTMLIFLWLFEFWTVSGYGKFLFWKWWILVNQMKITQRYVGSLINRITQIYFVFFFILP